MHLAACELPDQPGVDGAEEKLALLRPFADAGNVFEYPAELGAGEVSIYKKAGLFLDHVGVSGCHEGIAVFGGASALPDYGVVYGDACGLVPHDGGLALVGDAYAGDFLSLGAYLFNGFYGDAHLARPDLHGIVLYPAWFGVYLLE